MRRNRTWTSVPIYHRANPMETVATITLTITLIIVVGDFLARKQSKLLIGHVFSENKRTNQGLLAEPSIRRVISYIVTNSMKAMMTSPATILLRHVSSQTVHSTSVVRIAILIHLRRTSVTHHRYCLRDHNQLPHISRLDQES